MSTLALPVKVLATPFAILCVAFLACLAILGPVDTATASEGAVPDDATQLAEQQQISPEQAQQDLRLQSQAGSIVEELKAKLGSQYAGVWFDLKHGSFHIDVTSPQSQSLAEEVATKDGVFSATDFESVSHTWSELQAAEDTLNSQLTSLKVKQQAFVAADPKTNSVNVSVASDAAPGAVTQATTDAAATPVPTVVVPVVPQTLDQVASGCSFPYCPVPPRGGERINSESDPDGEYHFCTYGFEVYVPTPYKKSILTAGHCMEPGGHAWSTGIWSTSVCAFGHSTHILGVTNYGVADVGRIINEKNCQISDSIVAWGIKEHVGVFGEKELYVGRYLCKEGATSGSQCGEVRYVDVTTSINYSDEERGILNIEHTDQMCALGERGDSGGPWTVWESEPPTKAWGTDIDLAATEKTCQDGGTVTGYELHYALAVMGVDLQVE